MMITTESLQIPRGKHKTSNPWAVGITCITRRTRPGSPFGPYTCQRPLLTHTGFVLKPNLQWFAAGRFGQNGRYLCSEVFLNASCASGSDFGCCGRTDKRRKPSFTSCLPTVRSCMTTPKRSSILRLRSMRRQRTTPSVWDPAPHAQAMPTPPSVPR